MSTINVGQFNLMRVDRKVDFGFYMDDGAEGVLLPKRFVPSGLQVGDTISVFVYHDSDNRLIATTQEPFAVVGDIAALKVVDITGQGAFLDWGLMKDLFVPVSQQLSSMRLGGKYLVKLYLDKQTGRVAATEKIDNQISNDILTVKEGEKVKLQVYRESDIGYVVIVNQVHQGLVYKNEVFTHLHIGQMIDEGFVKKIREDNKLDIGIGKQGVEKLDDDQVKLIQLLKLHKGFLPYHDKSSPEDIYAFFGISKKAFKMNVGILYKAKKITLEEGGIRLIPEVQEKPETLASPASPSALTIIPLLTPSLINNKVLNKCPSL
jgi:predicted RNA-binding protein (virulence factor B family)